MIVADTSVWIEHLRVGSPRLKLLLENEQIAMHPLILGEIACGLLKNRAMLLRLLANLPEIRSISNTEAIEFIERDQLMGRGVGFVDIHLLGAVRADSGCRLWTFDKRLASIAEEMAVAHID